MDELDKLLKDLSKFQTPSPSQSTSNTIVRGSEEINASIPAPLAAATTAAPNIPHNPPIDDIDVQTRLLKSELLIKELKEPPVFNTPQPSTFTSSNNNLDNRSSQPVSAAPSQDLTPPTNTNNSNHQKFIPQYEIIQKSPFNDQPDENEMTLLKSPSSLQSNNATDFREQQKVPNPDINFQQSKQAFCHLCNQPIVGPITTALGKQWHYEHFVCIKCKKPLGSTSFFEKDGQPFCERDYHEAFSPRCAYCQGAITDRCINACNKTWHPDHFFCSQCGKHFPTGQFIEKDGKAYCEEDYYNIFAPKCSACDKPIMSDCVTAMSQNWHPSCFVCTDCKKPFNDARFFEHEGRIFCEIHYHQAKGSLCQQCNQPIVGRCVTALGGKKFHPNHFQCNFCKQELRLQTFREQNNKAFCQPCFVKLYG